MRIVALLDAIRSQQISVLEVVIVDTGSTDRTMDIVGRYQRHCSDQPLRCLSYPGAGIAGAVNRGIEAAQGEIIVRLDGHSRPRSDYVARALDALKETGAAVVGGVWDIAPGGPTRIAESIARAVAHPIGAGDAAGILVLTVVAPPGLATLVNRSRIDRARGEVRRLADAIQDTGLVARARSQTADLLGGPGNTPEAAGVRQWVDGRVGNLSGYVSEPIRSDPWGNRYLVNIGALQTRQASEAATEPRALWVLSAGPNGLIETVYAVPALSAVVGGDDIGARIE